MSRETEIRYGPSFIRNKSQEEIENMVKKWEEIMEKELTYTLKDLVLHIKVAHEERTGDSGV
jgi:hypothetical protein